MKDLILELFLEDVTLTKKELFHRATCAGIDTYSSEFRGSLMDLDSKDSLCIGLDTVTLHLPALDIFRTRNSS